MPGESRHYCGPKVHTSYGAHLYGSWHAGSKSSLLWPKSTHLLRCTFIRQLACREQVVITVAQKYTPPTVHIYTAACTPGASRHYCGPKVHTSYGAHLYGSLHAGRKSSLLWPKSTLLLRCTFIRQPACREEVVITVAQKYTPPTVHIYTAAGMPGASRHYCGPKVHTSYGAHLYGSLHAGSKSSLLWPKSTHLLRRTFIRQPACREEVVITVAQKYTPPTVHIYTAACMPGGSRHYCGPKVHTSYGAHLYGSLHAGRKSSLLWPKSTHLLRCTFIRQPACREEVVITVAQKYTPPTVHIYTAACMPGGSRHYCGPKVHTSYGAHLYGSLHAGRKSSLLWPKSTLLLRCTFIRQPACREEVVITVAQKYTPPTVHIYTAACMPGGSRHYCGPKVHSSYGAHLYGSLHAGRKSSLLWPKSTLLLRCTFIRQPACREEVVITVAQKYTPPTVHIYTAACMPGASRHYCGPKVHSSYGAHLYGSLHAGRKSSLLWPKSTHLLRCTFIRQPARREEVVITVAQKYTPPTAHIYTAAYMPGGSRHYCGPKVHTSYGAHLYGSLHAGRKSSLLWPKSTHLLRCTFIRQPACREEVVITVAQKYTPPTAHIYTAAYMPGGSRHYCGPKVHTSYGAHLYGSLHAGRKSSLLWPKSTLLLRCTFIRQPACREEVVITVAQKYTPPTVHIYTAACMPGGSRHYCGPKVHTSYGAHLYGSLHAGRKSSLLWPKSTLLLRCTFIRQPACREEVVITVAQKYTPPTAHIYTAAYMPGGSRHYCGPKVHTSYGAHLYGSLHAGRKSSLLWPKSTLLLRCTFIRQPACREEVVITVAQKYTPPTVHIYTAACMPGGSRHYCGPKVHTSYGAHLYGSLHAGRKSSLLWPKSTHLLRCTFIRQPARREQVVITVAQKYTPPTVHIYTAACMPGASRHYCGPKVHTSYGAHLYGSLHAGSKSSLLWPKSTHLLRRTFIRQPACREEVVITVAQKYTPPTVHISNYAGQIYLLP